MKEEILAKLEEIEKKLFYNDMIDHWTDRDRQERGELLRKKRELLNQLEQI